MPANLGVDEAMDAICGPRMAFYGPPDENIEDIARVWTPYIKRALEVKETLNGTDVCALMILLKVMRLVRGYHRDSMVDTIGYAQLMEVLNDKSAFTTFVHEASKRCKTETERKKVLALLQEERS